MDVRSPIASGAAGKGVALKRGTGAVGTGVFLLAHCSRGDRFESSVWLTLLFVPVFPLWTLCLETESPHSGLLEKPGSPEGRGARVRLRAVTSGVAWRSALGVYAAACALLALTLALCGAPVFLLGRVSNLYLAPAVALIAGFFALLGMQMDAQRWRLPLIPVWREIRAMRRVENGGGVA
jgi:hypothetical protein